MMNNRLRHINTLLRIGLAGLIWFSGASCAPRMIEVDGHRVFNPEYLWYLESEDRDRWQKPEKVMEALWISEGTVIADIGDGGGYFTGRFSNQVGKSGHVYAVDVQDVMIARLNQRVKEHGLKNVDVIKGRFESPMLPSHAIDIAFFSSVYKEIDDRVAYMKAVRRCLKPGGEVAIIEFYQDRALVGPELGDRLSETQVMDEMRRAGFVLINRFDFLPKEYFLLFGMVGETEGI
jgi:arsenite methyltransferase